MDIWRTAQGRLRADSDLTTQAARDAGALLKSGDLDRLHALAGSCKEQLDRLNIAHERARAALKSGQRAVAEDVLLSRGRLARLLRGLGGDGGGCDGAGRAHEGQCGPASELVVYVGHEHSPCGYGLAKADWNDSSELNRCGGGASVPMCSLPVQP